MACAKTSLPVPVSPSEQDRRRRRRDLLDLRQQTLNRQAVGRQPSMDAGNGGFAWNTIGLIGEPCAKALHLRLRGPLLCLRTLEGNRASDDGRDKTRPLDDVRGPAPFMAMHGETERTYNGSSHAKWNRQTRLRPETPQALALARVRHGLDFRIADELSGAGRRGQPGKLRARRRAARQDQEPGASAVVANGQGPSDRGLKDRAAIHVERLSAHAQARVYGPTDLFWREVAEARGHVGNQPLEVSFALYDQLRWSRRRIQGRGDGRPHGPAPLFAFRRSFEPACLPRHAGEFLGVLQAYPCSDSP